MTSSFIRYSDEIEVIDPKLEELTEQIVAFWEAKGRASPQTEGTGRAQRGAHSKSFGVVRAEVEIDGDLPRAYAQGIYAAPSRHDALMRFSSAAGHLGTDAQLGPIQGLAIKIFDVPGTKLVEDEPDGATFDYLLKNSPIFIANTARHYLFIEEIGDTVPEYLARGRAGFHELLTDFVTGKGTLEEADWAWDELFAFVRMATRTPVGNPLLTTFWTMGAARHGDYIAKVRLAPNPASAEHVMQTMLDIHSAPDVFGPALANELQARDFDFDLQVQLCTDLKTMPVNEVTVEWPEQVSPFVTVGRVHIPRQEASRPEDLEATDALAFNQWRVTEDHRPLGEIMRVRKIYSASARVRRTINHQPQTEPASADEVLPAR